MALKLRYFSLESEASVLYRISSYFVNWTILAAHVAGTAGTQNINLRSSVLVKQKDSLPCYK
jgi:hypothetical protein